MVWAGGKGLEKGYCIEMPPSDWSRQDPDTSLSARLMERACLTSSCSAPRVSARCTLRSLACSISRGAYPPGVACGNLTCYLRD